MRPRILLLVLALLLPVSGMLPTSSADEGPPAAGRLRLVTEGGFADTPVRLTLRLTVAGAPVAGADVVLQRRLDGAWSDVTVVTTDDAGRATTRAAARSRRPAENRFRAVWDGDATTPRTASAATSSRLRRRDGVVRLAAPSRVRDGREVEVRARWSTRQGEGVEGSLDVQRRDDGQWRSVRRLHTDREGRAAFSTTPRTDTAFRVVAAGLPWVRGARSAVRRIDNVPPGDPVRLPSAAPHPRVRLPAQPRATRPGPDAQVTTIPDGVWDHMTGRSWHPGCPVGRGGLRLLRVNYWGYDGYRYRGELVAATSAVDEMAGALAAMYRAGLPLRSLYRVDRFGWSSRLHGADDYRSMAAGNTSAFNCREVVGRPGVVSPHSYGRSLDVNTWENPYRSQQGLVPNAWWQGHSHPRVAWRSGQHPVVRIMRAHGLRWTYGLRDTQHFDVASASGRLVLPPGCRRVACD